MANLNSKIRKILLGFKAKGRIVTISQKQYYSEGLDKVFTKYTIDEFNTEKQDMRNEIKFLRKTNRSGINDFKIKSIHEEIIKKWPITDIECKKQIDVLLYLVEQLKGGENG